MIASSEYCFVVYIKELDLYDIVDYDTLSDYKNDSYIIMYGSTLENCVLYLETL